MYNPFRTCEFMIFIFSRETVIRVPLLVLSSLITMNCSTRSNQEPIGISIIEIEQSLMDGVAEADHDLWTKYLLDSCIITIEDGTRLTSQEFLKELKPLPSAYEGRIKVLDPKMLVLNTETVILSYIVDEYLDLYDQHIHTQYAQTNTWVNKDGWKLAAMQTFEIPKNPIPVDLPYNVEELTGIYSISPGVDYVITLDNGKLIGQRSGRSQEELFCEAGSVFFTKNASVRKIFIKQEDTITKMLDRRSGNDVIWKKIK